MIAIAALLLVVALSLVVTRVATVVLVATGMSRDAARFQARSALSGVGFTTAESEEILAHPLRRRVILNLMLLGSGGIVAGIGTLILGFRQGGFGNDYFRILELVVGLFVLLEVSRSRIVDRWLTRMIGRAVSRWSAMPTRDLSGLLDLAGEYSVSELLVHDGDWVAGHPLGELGLRDEGIAVLGITRFAGRYVGGPTGATVLEIGDTVVLYGREDQLRELDDRPAGPEGDLAHQAAVAVQARQERREAAAG